MLMQIGGTFEKTNVKILPLHKKPHKFGLINLLNLKQNFIRPDRLRICQLHLETVQSHYVKYRKFTQFPGVEIL